MKGRKRKLELKVNPPENLTERNARYIVEKVQTIKKLTKDARFIQNPLSREFFKKFQLDDTDFKQSYHSDLTEQFYYYLYWKVKNREPINISITGVQRGGKSALASSLAFDIEYLTDVPFPVDASQIFKNQTIFLKWLPRMVANGVYIVDEQKTQRSQIGSFAEDFEIEDVHHIIAKECIHQIWICPEFQDRDSEYLLKVIGIDRERALTKALIIDLKNSEDNFYRMFGYVVVPHYDPSVSWLHPEELVKMPDAKLNKFQLFRKNYELKKDAWNLEIKNRYSGDRQLLRIESARTLSVNPIFAKCKNKTQKVIVARAKLPEGYVEDEIREIVTLASNPALLDELIKDLKVKAKQLTKHI